jgi:hypothetical protein
VQLKVVCQRALQGFFQHVLVFSWIRKGEFPSHRELPPHLSCNREIFASRVDDMIGYICLASGCIIICIFPSGGVVLFAREYSLFSSSTGKLIKGNVS